MEWRSQASQPLTIEAAGPAVGHFGKRPRLGSHQRLCACPYCSRPAAAQSSPCGCPLHREGLPKGGEQGLRLPCVLWHRAQHQHCGWLWMEGVLDGQAVVQRPCPICSSDRGAHSPGWAGPLWSAGTYPRPTRQTCLGCNSHV